MDTGKRSPRKRAWLHIGTPRTGTTSLQHYLASDEGGRRLRKAGYVYPERLFVKDPKGILGELMHLELTLSSIRRDRRADIQPFVDALIGHLGGELPAAGDIDSWRRLTLGSIQEVDGDRLVMCDESLSWLYHEDEMSMLLELFAGWEVSVVCYLRHPDSFRTSLQYMASFMMPWTPGPESVFYMEPDSWIYNYELRMDRWRQVLGRENVITMSYEACLDRDGSVIPSFLELLGVEPPPAEELLEYHLNASQ